MAQRVGRGIALLFHDRSTRRGECSAARPGRNLLPGHTRYPFYRRLGGPQGRSGRAEYLVPTGIRSRTVQSVVSHYTDWATRPTPKQVLQCKPQESRNITSPRKLKRDHLRLERSRRGTTSNTSGLMRMMTYKFWGFYGGWYSGDSLMDLARCMIICRYWRSSRKFCQCLQDEGTTVLAMGIWYDDGGWI